MAETVNTHDAKTRLSRLLAQVEAGETIVIARDGKPIARLVPFAPRGQRRFGALCGQIVIGPDFAEPLPADELEGWER